MLKSVLEKRMRVSVHFVVLIGLLLATWSDATLSKTKKSKEKKKKPQASTIKLADLPNQTVLKRGLVQENVTYSDIVNNFALYSKEHKNERRFKGEVLAYLTPWNGHGYDVAKTFGKFTMISPVWLQIKRKTRGMYNVEGTHDIDKGWLKDMAKKALRPKIVPRILFDGWSESEYKSLFKSEDEIESMANVIVNVLKEFKLNGAVIEIWSQIGNKYPKEVLHVVTHMTEIFHENNLVFILVVPAAFNKDQKLMTTFRTEEFQTLAPHVDYFSLMTYDFSSNSGHAGPSAPLPWMRLCVEYLDPKAEYRTKILTGLNFYGNMFAQKGSSAIIGNQYVEFLRLYKPEVTWEPSVAEHYSKFGDENMGQGIVFFPSLKSIEERLNLANDSLGTGISIWEIGQGFDYFYDLL